MTNLAHFITSYLSCNSYVIYTDSSCTSNICSPNHLSFSYSDPYNILVLGSSDVLVHLFLLRSLSASSIHTHVCTTLVTSFSSILHSSFVFNFRQCIPVRAPVLSAFFRVFYPTSLSLVLLTGSVELRPNASRKCHKDNPLPTVSLRQQRCGFGYRHILGREVRSFLAFECSLNTGVRSSQLVLNHMFCSSSVSKMVDQTLRASMTGSCLGRY